MPHYSLNIEPEATKDIQQTIDYYNNIQPKLVKKFFEQIDKHFKSIKTTPKACHTLRPNPLFTTKKISLYDSLHGN